MDFEKMMGIEPRLKHLADSARAAKQQGGSWYDFWHTHHDQMVQMVGTHAACPQLRNDRAWAAAHGFLCKTWVKAELADPSRLAWSERPLSSTEPDRAARVTG